jgi:hypothetical protein
VQPAASTDDLAAAHDIIPQRYHPPAIGGGQVLEVRVDDPGAREDIAAWRRLAGHELLAVVDEMPKYTRYFLSKKHG